MFQAEPTYPGGMPRMGSQVPTPAPQQGGGGIFDAYGPPPPVPGYQFMPGDFNDPYNAYMASIPLMQENIRSMVGDSIAGLGKGQRYGTGAMNTAGRIGLSGALATNQNLLQTMFDQTQRDQDRAIGVGGMFLNATPMVEDALSARMGTKMGVLGKQASAASAADARRMAYENMRYQDFERNKYGTTPMLMGALTNSTGSGMEPITNTTAGKPGFGNDLIDLAKLWFSTGG